MTDLMDRLKRLGEKHGALSELSRMAGISPGILSRLVSGKRTGLRFQTAIKLLPALEAYEAGEAARQREIEARMAKV